MKVLKGGIRLKKELSGLPGLRNGRMDGAHGSGGWRRRRKMRKIEENEKLKKMIEKIMENCKLNFLNDGKWESELKDDEHDEFF